jgi:hypothetical protein
VNKFDFLENSLQLVTTHKPMLTISNDIFYTGSGILKAWDGAWEITFAERRGPNN